ncbi:MAG TPA: cation:proton antiporter regulatory subunit [Acidimicrobiales bacterium]|nr:cation:proton antiporter regulatory subunit [Acidimicrobiales bacterium]
MAEVRETKLPGVGVRHDFVTSEGERIGVLVHRTGRRELLVYDREDPDSCRQVVHLDGDDTRTLSEVLGSSPVSEALGELQQEVEGLTIDWITVEDASTAVGRTLRDAALRARTGVSIVAVLRKGETIPSPGPDFVLEGGDTAVTVGTAAGTQDLTNLLHHG